MSLPSLSSFSPKKNSISVVTASCAASLLVTLAILVFMGIERDSAELSEQIVLTVFLESGVTAKDLAATQSDLKTIVGIDSIEIQSADAVKEAFVSRFATSISAALPDNTFPTAMIVSLKEEYRTKERIDSIVSQALGMQSVHNVSYRTGFVEAVEKRQTQEGLALWVVAGVCALTVITLLWQAVYRADISLQKSAGAILIGVLLAIFLGSVVFANMKHNFPWLEQSGWATFLKVELLGSVAVCAFATFVLALSAVRQVAHQESATDKPENFDNAYNDSTKGGHHE